MLEENAQCPHDLAGHGLTQKLGRPVKKSLSERSGSPPRHIAIGQSRSVTSGHRSQSCIPEELNAAIPRTVFLSGRERAIFLLLGIGYDNRSIAREISLSEYTVKRHITAILTKLHLQSRLQAGLVALITSCRQDTCWHLGGMDAPQPACLSSPCATSTITKGVNGMIIEETKVSVARGGLPG